MSKLIWNDRYGYFDRIKDKKKMLVALDMGLGKTSLLLSLIDYKMNVKKEVKRVLIIMPKKVSLTTWQNEIKKWDNLKHLKDITRTIDGSIEKRLEDLENTNEYTIDIISSGLTEWLTGWRVPYGNQGKKKWIKNTATPKYDMVIVDECSQFKNPQSARFKALMKLRQQSQLFLLSGTPFPNLKKRIHDKEGFIYYEKSDQLYYAYRLLGIFNETLTSFRENFCYVIHKYDFDYKMREEVYNALLERMADFTITDKLKMDVALKETVIHTKNDMKKLDELTSEYLLEIDGVEISAESEVALINKALQIGNGFIYDDYGEPIYIHNHKIDVIRKFIETTNHNLVVAYNFKEDRERLLKEFDGIAKEYTPENEVLWNEGKIRMLILSPFSEKYGLNLQFGGNHLIWYSLIWSAESFEQLNRRLYRPGQTKDVQIYYLIAEGGYDYHVFKTLILKIDTQGELLTILKEAEFD